MSQSITPLTQKTTPQVSPVLEQSLIFPKAAEATKPKRQLMIDTLPDKLTSAESIRQISLKELEKIKGFSEREKKQNRGILKNNKNCSKR